MSDLPPVVYALLVCGAAAGTFRWLRVGQREHYLAGSVTRFAWRWWRLHNINRLLLLLAIAATIGAAFNSWLALVVVAAALVGPLGLSHRGVTSKLAWTRRLLTIGFVTVALAAVALIITAAFDVSAVALAAVALVLPGLVDLSLLATKPIERILTRRWVHRARSKLDRIDPVRVAITGSYGKTTMKGYLRHLVSGTRSVMASPASFNNTAGLCRSVNEHLERGTEVFIAEMGTYGRGEIAAMVRWVQPSISVLTAVGPVHLERFGSLNTVVAAKTEIFATAATAIINVDLPLLEAEAARLEASGISVIRCSTGQAGSDQASSTDQAPNQAGSADQASNKDDGRRHADVYVCPENILLFGRELHAQLGPEALPINVACAIATAAVLGVSDEDITARLPTIPVPKHRRQLSVSNSGVTVVDDTYNSNPAGAAAALQMLADAEVNRRVVVTPGMVELGSEQFKENSEFARASTTGVADDFLIVGRTNRTALMHGAHDGTAVVRQMKDLTSAVKWVRENLQPGDGVLYENDLPDHYS